MTGETERSPSAWTADLLKVLEDEKISALQELTESEFRRIDENIVALRETLRVDKESAQLAQSKFEATVERDSVKQNEFRGALSDVNTLKIDRREVEAQNAAFTARVDDLAKQLGDMRSRLDLGPAGLAQLQNAQERATGRQQGVTATTGFIVAVIVVTATFVGMIGTILAIATR